MSKKIAVVGAGLSGLAAAWMLRDSGFDVTVFEASAAAGGHVEMFEIELEGRKMQFDGYLGNFSISHNLLKINELLGVSVAKEAFGLCSDYPDKHWTTYQSSPFLEEHRSECLRLQALLYDLYERDSSVEATAVSLKDFLENNGFSEVFSEYVVCPFLEPMIGMGFEDLDQFPTSATVELLGTGISSFLQPTPLYVFGHGMHDFVRQFSAQLVGNIQYNCPVKSILRTATGVLLRLADGTETQFDEVVMTCNFETIRRLIENPTPAEISVFNGFSYKNAHLVVHTDTSIVPAYFFEDNRLGCLVNQHGISAPLASFDAPGQRKQSVLMTSTTRGTGLTAVDPLKILCERTYREEVLNVDTVMAKSLLHHVQGHQHCWYCGLSTTSPLTESTFVSGLVVAAQLGATYPFAHYPEAARVFDNIRRLMFGGHPSLRMFS